MPSSSRILLSRARVAGAGAGSSTEAGASSGSSQASSSPSTGGADAAPGRATLLQGRAARRTASAPGGASAAGGRAAAASAPLGASFPGLAGSVDPAAFASELRQMRRIAEERGYNEGRARAESELRGAIDAVAALAERIEASAPRETTAIAHAIAELSLAVARRIVQREVQVDPTVLCDALEDAVLTINGSPEARVLLHPAALDAVKSAWEVRHGLSHLGKRWTFEGDPNMPLGGCIVRYDHGFVDAGFESQIEEVGIALDRAIPGFLRETGDGARDVA